MASKALAHKATRQYVRHLSLDVLQRTPTPSELRMYMGTRFDMVAARMLKSLEAKRVWVEEELLFFLLLDNFRPQTESIQSLPGRMHKGQITAHEVIAEIMMSTGFTLRNPGNDTFVTVVLEQGIGMRVQDKRNIPTLRAGKKMYDGYKVRFLRKVGRSQSDIIKIVCAHPDFTRYLLDRNHRKLMLKPLARTKVAKEQVSRVQADPAQFFAVIREWLTSDQYLELMKTKRPRSDNQYIRSLYFDLLGRAPKYQEFRNMRNAMLSMADPAPLRSVMVKVILDSGQASLPTLNRGKTGEFVNECFLRYLGRPPTQAETGSFVELLADRRVTASHVVRALMTSTEYQYY